MKKRKLLLAVPIILMALTYTACKKSTPDAPPEEKKEKEKEKEPEDEKTPDQDIEVTSSSFFISDETSQICYPGCILKSDPIINNYRFEALTATDYKPLPITVSLSIPGIETHGTINNPDLSTARKVVTEIINKQKKPTQINSFSYSDGNEFASYNQLKYILGGNVDISKIMDIPANGDRAKISKKHGIVIVSKQENFTCDMDVPGPEDLISIEDANKLTDKYAPYYVSSITYGRFGIFMAETDADVDEFKVALKTAIKIGISKVDTKLTDAQKKMLDEAKIFVYMRFGSEVPYKKTVTGYQTFQNAMAEGAKTNADDYGVPISFRMTTLKDFNVVDLKFVVKI